MDDHGGGQGRRRPLKRVTAFKVISSVFTYSSPPQPTTTPTQKKRLNKQTSHRHSSPFPQTLFITGGWVWWREERGAGTPRHNKAALKGKGIIRFIASNESWKSQKILIQLINPGPRRGAEKVNRGQICEAASRVCVTARQNTLKISRLIGPECRGNVRVYSHFNTLLNIRSVNNTPRC